MRVLASRMLVATVVVSGLLLAGGALSSPAGAVVTVSATPLSSDGADGRVSAFARAGDRVFVGGDFDSVGGEAHANLAALDAATGQVVSTWRADTNGAVEALAPSSDGTVLYVGGAFTSVGGVVRRHVAALSTATGAVAAWNPNAIGGSVLALTATAGRVFLGGKFTTVAGVQRPYLAAVSTAGPLDSGFNAHMDGTVWALVRSPDNGTLYAGGDFHSAGGQFRAHRGPPPPADGDASGWHPEVTCPVLALDATADAVYAACAGGTQLGNSALAYAAASGNKLWTVHTDGNVQAVARLGGAVYIGGHFGTVDGTNLKKAAAVDADNGQVLPWNPHPNSVYGVMVLMADGGSLWMGGDFTTIHGASQPHIAHFA